MNDKLGNSATSQSHRLCWRSFRAAAVVALLAAYTAGPLLAQGPAGLCDSNKPTLCDSAKPPPPPPPPPAPKPLPPPKLAPPPVPETPGEWSFEFGSGALFSNVRTDHADGYTMIPAFAMASLKLDEPEDIGGGLQGYPEFMFRGYGMAIPDGPESRIWGLNFGPRYNFLWPGSKMVPFIGGVVGFGIADSRHNNPRWGHRGLGQDSNFQLGANTGFRVDLSERSFIRLMVEYAHISSLGLSDRDDRAIDAFGPEISFGWRF